MALADSSRPARNSVSCGPLRAGRHRLVDARQRLLASADPGEGEGLGKAGLEPGTAAHRGHRHIGEQRQHLPMPTRLADQGRSCGAQLRPPLRVGHLCLGLDKDALGCLAVGQTPEGPEGAGHSDDHALLIRRDDARDAGEQRSLLDVPPACEQDVGKDVRRLECAVGGPCGVGETFGRCSVEGEVGVAGRRQQEPGGRGAAAVEAPERQAYRVLPTGDTLTLEGVGQAAGEPATPKVGE